MKHTMATLRAFIARADTWDKFDIASQYVRNLQGRKNKDMDELEVELDRQYEYLRSLEE